MSHKGESVQSRKGIYVNLLMIFIFLVLVSFAIWLLWVTYFREHYDAGIIEFNYSGDTMDVQHVTANKSKNTHFHNSDTIIDSRDSSLSACIVCHGNYPHAESKLTRAYLNAHAYVMTCEVCHLNVENSETIRFRWLNGGTNEVSDSRDSVGQYKIIPVSYLDGRLQRYDDAGAIQYARKYMKNQYRATEAFKRKIIEKTHLNVSEEATSCNECHNAEHEPALLYRDLAYTSARIEELLRVEVAGMIHKYKDFYMPNLLRESESVR